MRRGVVTLYAMMLLIVGGCAVALYGVAQEKAEVLGDLQEQRIDDLDGGR